MDPNLYQELAAKIYRLDPGAQHILTRLVSCLLSSVNSTTIFDPLDNDPSALPMKLRNTPPSPQEELANFGPYSQLLTFIWEKSPSIAYTQALVDALHFTLYSTYHDLSKSDLAPKENPFPESSSQTPALCLYQGAIKTTELILGNLLLSNLPSSFDATSESLDTKNRQLGLAIFCSSSSTFLSAPEFLIASTLAKSQFNIHLFPTPLTLTSLVHTKETKFLSAQKTPQTQEHNHVTPIQGTSTIWGNEGLYYYALTYAYDPEYFKNTKIDPCIPNFTLSQEQPIEPLNHSISDTLSSKGYEKSTDELIESFFSSLAPILNPSYTQVCIRAGSYFEVLSDRHQKILRLLCKKLVASACFEALCSPEDLCACVSLHRMDPGGLSLNTNAGPHNALIDCHLSWRVALRVNRNGYLINSFDYPVRVYEQAYTYDLLMQEITECSIEQAYVLEGLHGARLCSVCGLPEHPLPDDEKWKDCYKEQGVPIDGTHVHLKPNP